jgi:hypothetical protein
MKDVMKFRMAISALLLTVGSFSYGQAVPAGGTPMTSMTTNSVGPNLPDLDGVMHYALSASEVVQLGYYGSGEVTHSTVLSGDASYTAKNIYHPFSVLVAGGVVLGNQPGQQTTGYVNMALSQGYVTRSWVFNVSDSVSFLPQSPTTGLSGIPGVGDLGALPVQGPVEGPAGGVLSNAGNRIANTVSGSVERQINRNTSLSGTGSYSILHFLDDNGINSGLDSAQVAGTVALNRRLDARSSVSVDAVYSTISFSGNESGGFVQPDIESRGLNLSYQRVLSRSLSVSLSVGPQWVSSSNSALIPSSLGVAATAGLSYARGFTTASLGYSRGVNAGSGVLSGAQSDSIVGSVGHTYGRLWVVSANGAFNRSTGLTQLSSGSSTVPPNEIFNTVFGGLQLTRRFGQHLSGYVSYGAQTQSNNFAASALNALNGTSQTFGVGVTFTPRSTRLGQF